MKMPIGAIAPFGIEKFARWFMTYYTKDLYTGKVYKGKAETWREVSLSYGEILYNPYSGKTVVGWNNYKKSMSDSYNKRFGKR